MPAIYIFFRNGDSVLLGCSESEGLSAYNSIMEDSAGFVDLNNGDTNFRVGVRTADVVSICFNPTDKETTFTASPVVNMQLSGIKFQRIQKDLQPETPVGPSGKDK